MKTLLTLASILFASTAQAFIVHQGDVLTTSFADLPFVNSDSIALGPVVTFNFGASNPFGLGDSFVADFYSDLVYTAPDQSRTYANQGTAVTSFFQGLSFFPGFSEGQQLNWNADRQGAIRLTVLSGSFDLRQVGIQVWNGSDLYGGQYSFNLSPVPEPTVLQLLTGALLGFGLRVVRRAREA